MTDSTPATVASMQNVLREGTDGTAEPPARVSAAGQFQRDHERDMADPEYAEAFREASAEVTATAVWHGRILRSTPSACNNHRAEDACLR